MKKLSLVVWILGLLALIYTLSLASPVSAKIIHVPGDSATIQSGINGAVNGDTVLVESGRYVENIDFLGKAILVASHFVLDSLESTIDSTIIDGDSSGSVVTFDSDEDSSSVLQGFTLTRGHATYGGAIYCNFSSPTIMNNFLLGNSCEPAKGGAGIYCGNGAKAKIIRNLIVDNWGPSGITVYIDSDVEIINNTISENSWGGIAVQSDSRASIVNNIITDNISYGILVRWDCMDTYIAYNDVWGDQENYEIIPDQTGNNGNISKDPLYQAPELGDYHLSEVSPCIDAGDPSFPVPPGGGVRIDMGVFEFTEFSRGDANGDGVVDYIDVLYLIDYVFREGPAPDPLSAGDANCDSLVDYTDVLYLIEYIFRDGPPPGCP